MRALRPGDPAISDPARVLVVDDEPSLRRALIRMLGRLGYAVTEALSGEHAMELAQSERFDVIVTDIVMPGMDGIELLRRVRGFDLDLPVILITGAPDVTSAIQAVDYGAFKYLLKPVDDVEFAAVVDRAVTLNRIARVRREAADALGQTAMLLSDRAGLEAKFSRAIDSLWIAYQPIVRSCNGHVFGYEGLLRTREPTLPHPYAVIEAAERLDRLAELGQSVRERAAEPLLSADGGPVLFVNLHPSDLGDPALRSADAPLSKIAHRVVLEVTERTSLDHVVDVRRRVAELREMGFRIALDDLGSGYAGLASLATLEPEIVKLDMVLIRDVHCSATKQKLVGSMTALCKDMGIIIVAEGVEKPEERETLIDLGCDLLQGFLFAEPGPAFPDPHW